MLAEARLASTLAALAALLAAPAARAAEEGAPEPGVTWEQTIEMQMSGFSMPAHTVTVCAPKRDWKEPPKQERDDKCRIKDFKNKGGHITWRMECDDPEMKGGEGDITHRGNSYDGTVTMHTASRGDATMKMHGKLIGDPCDAGKTKREAAAVKKQIKESQDQQAAAMAQACDNAVQEMTPHAFNGMFGFCKDEAKKKEFCARVPTREGYFKLAKHGPEMTKMAGQVCGTDMAAVHAKICKGALADVQRDPPDRDMVEFVANACPEEGRAVFKARCAGRSFTGVNRDISPICYKFAQEEMEQPQQAQPAAAPAPEKSTQDKAMDEAKKKVKGLFGF